jgi:hypothetical protein
MLGPGQRIVAGRVLYSAAWIDETASSSSELLDAAMPYVDGPDVRDAGHRLDSNQRSWD